MRVTRLGNDAKIIAFGPQRSGDMIYTTTVYEKAGRRLIVDTVCRENIKQEQVKTFSENGNVLKQIVVKFKDGVRSTLDRIR